MRDDTIRGFLLVTGEFLPHDATGLVGCFAPSVLPPGVQDTQDEVYVDPICGGRHNFVRPARGVPCVLFLAEPGKAHRAVRAIAVAVVPPRATTEEGPGVMARVVVTFASRFPRVTRVFRVLYELVRPFL